MSERSPATALERHRAVGQARPQGSDGGSEPNLAIFLSRSEGLLNIALGEIDGSKDWLGRNSQHGLRDPAL